MWIGIHTHTHTHTQKIANKISRTLGVMNRSKRDLPFSAMELMYDLLVLSRLQFGIIIWGFQRARLWKLQKTALRIMTKSRCNAHTQPHFKQLHFLKVKHIDLLDAQCLKFWYKFVNNKLPNYFRDVFKHNDELHSIETRNHDRLHLYPTRTSGTRNVLRQHIPQLLNKSPKYLIDRIKMLRLYWYQLPAKLKYIWLLYGVMNASTIAMFATTENN